jgi:hypothetical protein
MNVLIKRALHCALCAAMAGPLGALGDEDDQPVSKTTQSGTAALDAEQQRAVGVTVAHPAATKAPERIAALGSVLDESTLIADEGDWTVAAAQEHAASAELARLTQLSKDGVGASMKMLEAAQAEDAKARSDARVAAARFALHWGPLAAQSPDARRQLIDALTAGHTLLVRADLPGHHILGALPSKALLDVDGVEVPGRVLGGLRQFTELQSAGVLVEVRNPPPGLAPGAHVPLTLLDGERSGLFLPSAAVLYGEDGPYVYKQLPAKPQDEKAIPGEKAGPAEKRAPAEKATHYVAVKVTLLVPYGDGWLVKGVDDDDDIVVHGTGVLWSLEGVGAHPADDDDED